MQQKEFKQMWKSYLHIKKKFIKMVKEKNIKGKLEITPTQRNAADFHISHNKEKEKKYSNYIFSVTIKLKRMKKYAFF